MFTALDHQYMALALQLAAKGLYSTSPNPRVGCVIVHQNQIVGQGAHLKAGEPHAEVFALQEAGALAKGATAYVTLEPCSHHGRTPPCAEALVKAGIAKVIAAMQDPNPLVAGRGLAYLSAHQIKVDFGLMEAQAKTLNPGFIARMEHQKPHVRIKLAASLDGKTALANGKSQWVTSEASRLDVQHWRARACAIMTGIGTVLADNPRLTVRDIETQRQPLRVIVDSHLKTPLNAQVLNDGHALIAYAHAHEDKLERLQAMGVALLYAPNAKGKVCLKTLLSHLAELQINELMVESGQGLNGALIAEGLADELLIYYAPKLMGSLAQNMFDLPALQEMQEAFNLDITDVRQIGKDIRLSAVLKKA